MKKYYLTLSHPTHIGKKLYQDTYIVCAKFSKRIRGYFQRSGYNPCLIGNIDKTPDFFNMPSTKTVEKIGKKFVHVNTHKQEKLRVNILLTILADGGKLPSYILFKGNSNFCNLENQLNKLDLIKEKKYSILVMKMHGLLFK